MKKKLLLIVDPQIDFISGSLPVEGASGAMHGLADFIRAHDGDYQLKIITADSHPYNHCSFRQNGGTWPLHCVADSVGAAIFPAVLSAVYETSGDTVIVHKGCLSDREEYSAFGNEDAARIIDRLIRDYAINLVDICGLAGDVCVLTTLSDLLDRYPDLTIRILSRFSPSIDGGVRLNSFIENNMLKCDR